MYIHDDENIWSLLFDIIYNTIIIIVSCRAYHTSYYYSWCCHIQKYDIPGTVARPGALLGQSIYYYYYLSVCGMYIQINQCFVLLLSMFGFFPFFFFIIIITAAVLGASSSSSCLEAFIYFYFHLIRKSSSSNLWSHRGPPNHLSLTHCYSSSSCVTTATPPLAFDFGTPERLH